MWNSLEIAKFIATLATPVVVALTGFWISARLKAQDRRLYREDTPHIELKLDCQFHGIRSDKHLATFTVTAANIGRVHHLFPQIMLRVRGIKDEPFEYFANSDDSERAGRAAFPYLLLRNDLIPRTWNFVFIEPGVKQDLSFTTLIPSDYSYLLAHAEANYDADTPHTADAVFAVPESYATRSR